MASRLIEDLRQVPNIVGSLGLAVAEAQKHFDENYLRGLERLAVLAKAFLGNGADGKPVDTGVSKDFLEHLVSTAAPTRYQFTETTLNVRLDLAESRDWSLQAGVAFGFAGMVVNAGFAYGGSTDYRAGAEVRTVLHAVLPQDNANAFKVLLERAAALTVKLELPERTQLDERVLTAMTKAAEAAGAKPAKVELPAVPAGGE